MQKSVLTDNKKCRIQSEATERVMTMYSMKHIRGHIQVFDRNGRFLFSADTEWEALEELESYEEYSA